MSTPTTPPGPSGAGAPKPHDSVTATRFLGSSADAKRAESGAKTIVTSFVLACLLILLLLIVLSFRDTLGQRMLVTIATPRFDSPLIPPLEFVQQDLDRLRAADGMELSTESDAPAVPNLTTSEEFKQLTEALLPNLPARDTLIVYVRLHAVGTDDGELYLLPSDADPYAPEQEMNASLLLEAVARANCRNKLVLIDIGQSPRRLQLGWFGENIRERLTNAYKTAVGDDPDVNMLMICAPVDGRQPVSSAAVQQSIFGGLAGYCLHGGNAVDGAVTHRRDGTLTSDEIAAFLEQTAGAWTLSGTATDPAEGGRAATPFPVAGVNELLYADAFFAGREPLNKAGEAENERRRQASQQPSGGSGNAGKSGLVPTTVEVLNRLRESWRKRDTLATSMAPYRRPRNWALYHQELRRAESLLLAGKVEEAQAVLNSDVAPLEQDMEAPSPAVIRYPWSLAYSDLVADAEQTSRWRSILEAAAQTPTRQNLDRLRGAPFVEVEVARRAADALVKDPAGPEPSWSNPEVLGRAIATRTLAEQVARFQRPAAAAANGAAPAPVQTLPEMLGVIQDRVDVADRWRHAAEQELYLGRTDVAEHQFDLALAEYRQVQVKAIELQEQLASFHRMLVEIVPYSEWLAGTSSAAAWRLGIEGRLAALLRGTVEFRRNPSAEQLAVLAALCDELRGAARTGASEAVEAREFGNMYAALELPFLDAAQREDIVVKLVERSDIPLSLAAGSGSVRATDRAAGETPYRVAELAAALDVGLADTVTAGTFRNALSSRLARVSKDSAPGENGYAQFVCHLIRSPFQTALLRQTLFQPKATNEIVARMTMDHLVWQMSRLAADQVANAVEIAGPRSVILRNLREADPAFTESRGQMQLAFSAATPQVTPGESHGRLQMSVSLSSLMQLTEADDPHFVVDWFAGRSEYQVVALGNTLTPAARVTAGDSPEQWRLSVPVLELARSGAAQVQIELALRSDDGDIPRAPKGELAGWIALANGSRYWLPISLQNAVLPRRPLAIVFSGPDQAPLPDLIRMYPNQQVPLQIQVRGALAGTDPPRLVINSSGLEQACDAKATAAREWSVVPTAFNLPIKGARIEAQAFSGSEVVGARTLTIDVMNPRTFMKADVTYAADTRTITARIRRMATASLAAVIPVQLEVSGAELEGGILEGELQPDTDVIALEAIVVAGSQAAAYDVAVGACGVPGMFLYSIDPVTGLVERSARTRVEVLQPKEGATYAAALEKAASLSVTVAADADGPGQLHLGLDRDGDGYLQASERVESRETWSGKGVETRFVGLADPAVFVIESRVSNIVAAIPAGGLVGSQQLLAQLAAGGQFPTAVRTIHFVQTAPVVEFESPRQNDAVVFGDPFVVTLNSPDKSRGAIAHVEVGVDLNNNGMWDDGESLSPLDVAEGTAAPFSRSAGWTKSYDSRKLLTKEEQQSSAQSAAPPAAPAAKKKGAAAEPEPKSEAGPAGLPRRLILMARAVTPVQELADPAAPVKPETSPIAKRAVRLVAQGTKPKPTGQISGHVVTVDGLRQRDVEVKLGEIAVKTDDKGEFLFKDVPPGTHVVKAARGLRVGESEVQVIGGQTTSGVEISIKR